jgi:hypothetical protein
MVQARVDRESGFKLESFWLAATAATSFVSGPALATDIGIPVRPVYARAPVPVAAFYS